jgi:hypothetical protein
MLTFTDAFNTTLNQGLTKQFNLRLLSFEGLSLRERKILNFPTTSDIWEGGS